jgi:hypothetical protein
MKQSNTSSTGPSYVGHVQNGVVVLDVAAHLAEGLTVRVQPLGLDVSRDDERSARVSELRRLFDAWTEEDGKLNDAQAGCLSEALEASRGLQFRSADLT